MPAQDSVLTESYADGPGYGALLRLTDDTGMAQHSRFTVPDRAHGYCIDDNARALLLMAIADDLPPAKRSELSHLYAAFVSDAWNEDTRSFRNFMGFDRSWLEHEGSSDSNGRTLWALAITEARSPDPALSRWAATLFDQTAPHLCRTDSPRTAAFLLLSTIEIMRFRGNDGPVPDLLNQSAEFLFDLFGRNASSAWTWFEPYLSYDNCRLPEALILAGARLGREDMTEAGMAALSWLAERQTAPGGHFRPVATEEFGIPRSAPFLYDQQPIEAWAAIEAAIAAQQVRPDLKWQDHGEAAFGWFTGANDASHALGDAASGECFDGINAAGVNLNCGAESVLAWQFAQRRIKTLRALDNRP